MFKYGIALFLIPFVIQPSNPSHKDHLSDIDYYNLQNYSNRYTQLYRTIYELQNKKIDYTSPEDIIYYSNQKIQEFKKPVLISTLSSAVFCCLCADVIHNPVDCPRHSIIDLACLASLSSLLTWGVILDAHKDKRNALAFQSVIQQIQAYNPQQLKEFTERSRQCGHSIPKAFCIDFLSKKME